MTSSCARFGVGFGRLGAAFDGSGKHIDHHRAKPFFFSVLPGAFCHGQLVVFAAGTPFSVDEVGGNHLFFYDVPVRAAWMEAVVRGLPFGA